MESPHLWLRGSCDELFIGEDMPGFVSCGDEQCSWKEVLPEEEADGGESCAVSMGIVPQRAAASTSSTRDVWVLVSMLVE